jgi:hypothetical protein
MLHDSQVGVTQLHHRYLPVTKLTCHFGEEIIDQLKQVAITAD